MLGATATCYRMTAARALAAGRVTSLAASFNYGSAGLGVGGRRTRPRGTRRGYAAACAEPSNLSKEHEGNRRPRRGPRPGVLSRLPNVSPSEDLLNSALKRSSRVTPTKGLRDATLKEKNRSAKQLDALTTALCKPLGDYTKGFPKVERLHPFEKALLELTLSEGRYEATLFQVNALRKGMLEIGKGFASQAAKAKGYKEAISIREKGFVEMESYFKRGMHSVDELKEIAKSLRRLPVAELETPTVALVGAPNVGKSSLVRVLSSGTPEVCNYPFTTRGIKMGHFFIQEQRHIVTDTPGLLWRPDEERNRIEQLAIATLEHLPTCIVFVTDLSGISGTTVDDQLSIRAELHERFAHRRPWLDVMSKSALVPALGGTVSPEMDGIWCDDDDAACDTALKALPDAVSVSAEEGAGVDQLKALITEVLTTHRDSLMEDKSVETAPDFMLQ